MPQGTPKRVSGNNSENGAAINYWIKTTSMLLFIVLKTENLAVYLIFTLVLAIALFNVVGALIMMIVDKRPQFSILKPWDWLPANKAGLFSTGCLISIGGGVINCVPCFKSSFC